MYHFFTPILIPQRLSCPADHPIYPLLPPVIQQLLNVAPTALIGQAYGKRMAKYYRDYYYAQQNRLPFPQLPKVEHNHHFHIVIIDDPIYRRSQQPITPTRAAILLNTLREFVGNTGGIIQDPAFVQIQEATIGHFKINITIGYPNFASFVIRDQPYLINPHHNAILLNSQMTADALFALTPDELEYTPDFIATANTAHHDDNDDSDDDDAFYDASSTIEDDSQDDSQSDSTEYDTGDEGANSTPRIKKVKTAPQAKKKNTPPKNNISNIPKEKTPLAPKNTGVTFTEREEQPPELSMFSRTFWTNYLKPKKTSPTLSRYRDYILYKQNTARATLPLPENKRTPREAYLKSQIIHHKDYLSNDPDTWLNAQRRLINPRLNNADSFKADYKQAVIKLRDALHQTVLNATPGIAEAINAGKNSFPLELVTLPSALAATYTSYDSCDNSLNLFRPSLYWGGAALLYIVRQALLKAIIEYDNLVWLKCLKSQPIGESDITLLALQLLKLNKLNSGNKDLLEVIEPESQRGQCLLNWITLTYHRSKNDDVQADIALETVLCLASIHGKTLIQLVNNNDVPEINIPFMTTQAQEMLFEEKIRSLATYLPEDPDPKNHLSPEQRKEIRDTMDTILLIYALRNKTAPSAVFSAFEENYPEFTQYINGKINAFVKNEPVAIHQFAPKSKLFTCALIEKRELAIQLLDRMSVSQANTSRVTPTRKEYSRG